MLLSIFEMNYILEINSFFSYGKLTFHCFVISATNCLFLYDYICILLAEHFQIISNFITFREETNKALYCHFSVS